MIDMVTLVLIIEKDVDVPQRHQNVAISILSLVTRETVLRLHHYHAAEAGALNSQSLREGVAQGSATLHRQDAGGTPLLHLRRETTTKRQPNLPLRMSRDLPAVNEMDHLKQLKKRWVATHTKIVAHNVLHSYLNDIFSSLHV